MPMGAWPEFAFAPECFREAFAVVDSFTDTELWARPSARWKG